MDQPVLMVFRNWSSINQQQSSKSVSPLSHLLSLKEATSLNEDWAGISDSAKRRKLQNRLNQRACRNRHARGREKQSGGSGYRGADAENPTRLPIQTSPKANDGSVQQSCPSSRPPNGGGTKFTWCHITQPGQKPSRIKSPMLENENSHEEALVSKRSVSVCKFSDSESQVTIIQIEHSILRNYLLGSPAIDDLLTLIPFNMYRALISNAQLLGLDMKEMSPDDAISSFSSNTNNSWHCPPSLLPTLVQRQIPHHPWLDLFPIPQMRDNMILKGDDLDDSELCLHLVGFTSVGGGSGIAIWGEAWDPLCWEVTESFVQNWKWILQGCDDLIKSSNEWRAIRGEKPLSLSC